MSIASTRDLKFTVGKYQILYYTYENKCGCPVDKKILDIRRDFVVEGISADWFETDVSFLCHDHHCPLRIDLLRIVFALCALLGSIFTENMSCLHMRLYMLQRMMNVHKS
jgi:hypothetical protein